jgi:hypothetical protein
MQHSMVFVSQSTEKKQQHGSSPFFGCMPASSHTQAVPASS